jgi:carbon starvation protein
VARFLVQEFGGRIYKPLERTHWLPGTLFATFVVVLGWGYFIWTGNISTIWPMFGTANQLLAGVALAVITACIINSGKVRYVWVSLAPLVFIGVTTLYAGWRNIFDNFLPLISRSGQASVGVINVIMTVIIMACLVVIVVETCRRSYKVLVQGRYTVRGEPVLSSAPDFKPPEYGEA